MHTLIWYYYFRIIEINNFRDDLRGISAETATLVVQLLQTRGNGNLCQVRSTMNGKGRCKKWHHVAGMKSFIDDANILRSWRGYVYEECSYLTNRNLKALQNSAVWEPMWTAKILVWCWWCKYFSEGKDWVTFSVSKPEYRMRRRRFKHILHIFLEWPDFNCKLQELKLVRKHVAGTHQEFLQFLFVILKTEELANKLLLSWATLVGWIDPRSKHYSVQNVVIQFVRYFG